MKRTIFDKKGFRFVVYFALALILFIASTNIAKNSSYIISFSVLLGFFYVFAIDIMFECVNFILRSFRRVLLVVLTGLICFCCIIGVAHGQADVFATSTVLWCYLVYLMRKKEKRISSINRVLLSTLPVILLSVIIFVLVNVMPNGGIFYIINPISLIGIIIVYKNTRTDYFPLSTKALARAEKNIQRYMQQQALQADYIDEDSAEDDSEIEIIDLEKFKKELEEEIYFGLLSNEYGSYHTREGEESEFFYEIGWKLEKVACYLDDSRQGKNDVYLDVTSYLKYVPREYMLEPYTGDYKKEINSNIEKDVYSIIEYRLKVSRNIRTKNSYSHYKIKDYFVVNISIDMDVTRVGSLD